MEQRPSGRAGLRDKGGGVGAEGGELGAVRMVTTISATRRSVRRVERGCFKYMVHRSALATLGSSKNITLQMLSKYRREITLGQKLIAGKRFSYF